MLFAYFTSSSFTVSALSRFCPVALVTQKNSNLISCLFQNLSILEHFFNDLTELAEMAISKRLFEISTVLNENVYVCIFNLGCYLYNFIEFRLVTMLSF